MAVAAMMSTAMMKAASNHKIAGMDPARFTIAYSDKAESEEGHSVAEAFQKKLAEVTGKTIPVASFSKMKIGGETISFAHSANMKVFDYAVKVSHGNLIIDGGGCWAMQKAADLVAEQLTKKDIPADFQLKGSVC